MQTPLKHLGISRVHNASVTLLQDGEIVYHLENERLSGRKYDAFPFQCLTELDTSDLNGIAIAGVGKLTPADCFIRDDAYSLYVKTKENNYDTKVYDLWAMHHHLHAAHAFYNSGFDEAVCIVKDGMGSSINLSGPDFEEGSYGREITTTYKASYPANFAVVDKHIAVPFKGMKRIGNTTVSDNIGEGLAFQKLSQQFGFHELDAGKVMGMASYGNEMNFNLYKDGYIDNHIFTVTNNDLREVKCMFKPKDFQSKCDLAATIQKHTQEHVGQYILDMIEKTGCKNVCLSGGFFLNCVANYYYLSILPEDVNLYIEPVSSDAGTSIGAAKYIWHKQTNDTTKRPLQNLYLGPERNEFIHPSDTKTGKYVTDDDVADLLIDGKVVAIYQGRSEAGPRALGNRSILFDPRNPAAKDIINRIKKREEFRPFAGTVLAEYADEYFDMRGLKESPFMMYAVDVLSDKIPGITHVDNTCRIQTVTKEQNPHYYGLINSFHKKTGVPILFNTSFNLAGECIVETPEDAIRVLNNSDIDYVYFAEFKVLHSGQ
ncbi:carbamoyltransferase [Synechococcus phage S-MS29]|nr:carbamoyltransferase [Synechococcus phage S-MS29]